MTHYRLAVQVVVTTLILSQRFYFGPVGIGAGVVDALTLFAIWSNKWGLA
jgi:hypothetical protein